MDGLVLFGPSLLRAAFATIVLSSIVVALGTLAGVAMGGVLTSGPRWARAAARTYVDVMRGIPILVLLYTAFFVSTAVGVNLDPFMAAVVALSVFATAHIAEITRGGLESLSRTTIEAALITGLTARQRLRFVTAPMLLPRVLPPWVNTSVEIVKATSLASLIGFIDLTYATQSAAAPPRDPWPFYLFAAAVYFAINVALSQAGAFVERRFRYLEY